MLVYLVRHTPVDVPTGVCYGRSNVGLHADWRQHVAAVRARLPVDQLSGDNVYSSPLSRCVLLAQELSDSVRQDELLREMDFGDWELNAWDAVPRQDIDRWLEDLANTRAPGGEALGDVYARATRFLSWLGERPHDVAFVVTHGGVIGMRAEVNHGPGKARIEHVGHGHDELPGQISLVLAADRHA